MNMYYTGSAATGCACACCRIFFESGLPGLIGMEKHKKAVNYLAEKVRVLIRWNESVDHRWEST